MTLNNLERYPSLFLFSSVYFSIKMQMVFLLVFNMVLLILPLFLNVSSWNRS